MAQAISVSTLSTSVASQNSNSPTIRFRSIEHLLQTIDNVSGDFLIVTHVSPYDLEQIFLSQGSLTPFPSPKGRIFRLRRYDDKTGMLLVTIPTGVHEALHLHLSRKLAEKMRKVGLWNSWGPIGSATFQPPGHLGEDAGEGYCTGGPDPERATQDAWPTFVIVAGDSEPLGELRKDVRWWFSASDHEVNVVLLTKFDHTRREILIEKWEEDWVLRLDPIGTKRSVPNNTLEPAVRQTIAIAQNTTTKPVSYNVTGDALILSFRLLFLRGPGPEEGDIIISLPELEEYAEYVWRFV
ncbi:hypothetical protein GGS24DRAFT_71093 [Hypoxylon argillaceum]|nr:hypothetical protein GGS24DRAFT_71093 [Hypoxylon argillaceum]